MYRIGAKSLERQCELRHLPSRHGLYRTESTSEQWLSSGECCERENLDDSEREG
jgi:hypothetical protein